ncbi:hypothetical protein CEXT_726371 [Caerostris extrusa]|uniref:Uncharacterized protein n=1 Tax=Caerostris extrusa TaxID=172846 RepID=A0AAV4XMT6_CAEEX|nr:hypothetical protein CEXT_726371 [Caerostris extrusa]
MSEIRRKRKKKERESVTFTRGLESLTRSKGKWYIKGDIFRFKTRYISDPSEADTYYKKSLQPINMRFLVLSLLVLTVLMVQRTSCQRGPTGPVGQQIMCYSCLGNDQFKMECCGSTNQCCGGKVKKLGSFPQPATTSPGDRATPVLVFCANWAAETTGHLTM